MLQLIGMSVLLKDTIVGSATSAPSAIISNSYWDVETTGLTSSADQPLSDGGTGLLSEQMRGLASEDSIDGLDFDDTWDTVPSDYPPVAGKE